MEERSGKPAEHSDLAREGLIPPPPTDKIQKWLKRPEIEFPLYKLYGVPVLYVNYTESPERYRWSRVRNRAVFGEFRLKKVSIFWSLMFKFFFILFFNVYFSNSVRFCCAFCAFLACFLRFLRVFAFLARFLRVLTKRGKRGQKTEYFVFFFWGKSVV